MSVPVSANIDTFMRSADNAAARTNLGVLPLAGGTMTGDLTLKAAGLLIPGVVSGTATVQAPPVAGTPTITLPSVTATLATLGANGFTGQQIVSTNGAASTPPVLLSGTIFTGGSATTTKPALLVEPTGTTSNNWSTNGTLLGLNAPSGFTGNILDLQINGTRYLALSGTVLAPGSSGGTDLGQYNLGFGTLRVRTIFAESGSGNSAFSCNQDIGVELGQSAQLGWGSGAASVGDNDAFFMRSAAANIQMGANHATTATNQTFKAHDVTTGNAANLTIKGGTSGGSGNNGSVNIEGYDCDTTAGSNINLTAGGSIFLNSANRVAYSTDGTDIAAALVAFGLMSPA